ncbi:low-affinity Zn(2+) transporter zrt2 [Coniosporium apollinis]|uniref:Low-affinity Zn(2+) transporter zrt2 n=1 Tax=Coniosporium apollinis TaxID=61459 RepID=A0ABQ9NL92_9PEZI|nr:low-affinity Zn(2+) transporter zrt2 [Coniosporium apollinis]
MAETFAHTLQLAVRQIAADTATSSESSEPEAVAQCSTGNEFDGRLGLRISAIFVILIGSTLGAWFPVYARRHAGLGVPEWAFFTVKYFGSGIILATAFIHLLAPAHEALSNECLTGPITEYPWVEGISLMTIFVLFFLELMTMRYGHFGGGHDDAERARVSSHSPSHSHSHSAGHNHGVSSSSDLEMSGRKKNYSSSGRTPSTSHAPGEDHLGHAREHTDNEDIRPDWEETGLVPETFVAQMTAIFILEFGVIFHSVFIGLTLAVAGEEFITLYIVLVFHQTFEGLGLGSRLSAVPWPKSKKWTPYLLAGAYGISTPIAIAVGLGVRTSYPPGSATTLIVNGVFDSISAGILIYTGLVELMAHEFMFSSYMNKAPIRTVLGAFGWMCLGAGLMALLGRWA